MTPYAIVAPIGGFGNHVRWLALLDKKFKIEPWPYAWNQQTFDHLKGPSWPKFASFDSMPAFVKQECNELSACIVFPEHVTDKVQFISNEVYSKSRSWHNWLKVEWTYRKLFDSVITFSHAELTTDRCLKVIVNPELAHKCYIKFNSNTNRVTKEEFINTIKIENAAAKNYKYCIDSTALFSEVLDKRIYADICQCFDLDDNYEHACKIHSMWYNLHLKSEKEIVSYFTNLYS